MPLSKFVYVQDDFDGDAKTVSYDTMDVTIAGGFAAWETKLDALQSGLALWAVGREHRVEHVIVAEENGPGKATSPIAQGNIRLIIEGQDVLTGTIYRFPLPMPDLGKASDGTDPAWIAVGQGSQSLTVANPLHADYATLKTAFEAIAMSPNGNGVDLVRAYIEE
jgi:hypothetical protein